MCPGGVRKKAQEKAIFWRIESGSKRSHITVRKAGSVSRLRKYRVGEICNVTKDTLVFTLMHCKVTDKLI